VQPASSRGNRSRRGDAAKRSLILAAERLIGDRGYRAVSLREIALAAGQRNNSAAQYHFGSKRGLVEAVLRFRMQPINERRLAMLADMAATGRSEDLRSLVEALIVPWLEAVGDPERPTHYARFLSQVAFLPDFNIYTMLDDSYTGGLRIVQDGILHSMENLPRPIAVQRTHMINRLMVSAMADQERTAQFADGWWRVTAPSDLIDLAVAMVCAPVSPEAEKEMATYRAAHPSPARTNGRTDQRIAPARAAAYASKPAGAAVKKEPV
jgi:AcrR family transcriptional regulator